MIAFFVAATLFALALAVLGKFGRMSVRKGIPWKWSVGLSSIFCLLVLASWSAVTHGARIEDRMIAPLILPSPREVLMAFPRLHYQMGLVRSLIVSFERIALGFGLAAIVAVPLGVLMASFNRIDAFFKPVAVVSGYVPIVVFIPLSLAWFGIGETQKVGFLFIGCFVALLPAVIHAINDVPNDYIDVVATKGASQWQIVTQVLVPVAGPSIWQSLRVVYGIGWGWIILAEIVNGDAGLGYLVNLSERRGLTSNIYAIILIIVAVAVVCDKIWIVAGHKLFPYAANRNH